MQKEGATRGSPRAFPGQTKYFVMRPSSFLPTASLLVAPPAIQTQIHQCHHNFILETNQHVTLNLLTIPD
jgi:hypothetical protein